MRHFPAGSYSDAAYDVQRSELGSAQIFYCLFPDGRYGDLLSVPPFWRYGGLRRCTETEENRNNSINKSFAVLTKIIELINDLKLKIVAEGVETKEMVDALSEKGVDYLQGYYFSKPLKEEDFIEFLESTAE